MHNSPFTNSQIRHKIYSVINLTKLLNIFITFYLFIHNYPAACVQFFLCCFIRVLVINTMLQKKKQLKTAM